MISTALVTLLVLIALAIPVAAALGVLGLILEAAYSQLPLVRAMGEVAWSASNEFLLVSVPLFVLLGEILLRAGFAERMYGSLIQWVSWLPGGLMHSNIATCGIFAATSGSSVATAATVGTVALPQARRFGYNERVFLGTLAAGGTLGILIPPSINMIIYAVLTNTSVPKLYLAGIVPGVLLMLLFMLIVVLLCVVRPAWGGQRVIATWPERIAGTRAPRCRRPGSSSWSWGRSTSASPPRPRPPRSACSRRSCWRGGRGGCRARCCATPSRAR